MDAWSFAGSALGAVGSLVSGALSNRQYNKVIDAQIKAQAEENQKNREYNLMLARLQNKWSLEQWQRENDYNSPSAVMSRLRSAGVNPALAYTNGAAGPSLRSASSPDLTAGAPSTPQDLSSMLSKRTFGSTVQQSLDNFLQLQAIRKTTAETKNLDKDTEKKGGEIVGLNIDNLTRAARNEQALKVGDSTILLNQSMASLNDKKQQEILATISKLNQDVEESRARISEIGEKIGLLSEQQKTEQFNRMLKSEEFKVYKNKAMAEIRRMDFENSLTSQQIEAIAMKLPLEIMQMHATKAYIDNESVLTELKGVGQMIANDLGQVNTERAEFDFSQAQKFDTFNRIANGIGAILGGAQNVVAASVLKGIGPKPTTIKGFR